MTRAGLGFTKQEIYMRLSYYLYFLLSVLGGCNYPSGPNFQDTIRDTYTSTNFEEVDLLRYQQNYEQASRGYQTQLQSTDLSWADSVYAINQIAYCQLIMNKVEGVAPWLDRAENLLAREENTADSLLVNFLLNKGRYCFLRNARDSALIFTHKSLKLAYTLFPTGHLKTAQGLTLLSLIHAKDGNLTDSIHYYTLQANDVFLNNPELSPYDWENDYVQAYSSLLYRAHERGEFYCKTALQKIGNLPFENKWLEARLLNLWGNLSKKHSDDTVGENWSLVEARQTQLYQTADSLLQKAIAVGIEHEDSELMDFYVDWIINTTRFSDSTYFFQAMQDFENQFAGEEAWQAHQNRLLGYYHYGTDAQKMIQYYSRFLEIKDNDPNTDYRKLADSYYCLRVGYRELGDFARSANYAKKSFLLYDCINEEVDIVRAENIQQIDSTKRYCLTISGFFAEGLLKKYQVGKDPADLELANAYFDFIERHSFKSLLNKDEGAFLSFQLEAGSRIYANSLEAASEAWAESQDDYWLDKSFTYMEYLKSYLLYRDMLREEVVESGYSLSDSIRLLQGQVNQMLFTLRGNDPESAEKGYDNNLINSLNQLEHQRGERLNAFEAKGYRSQVKVEEIQKDLLPKQGVVNYYGGRNQLFGLYIDRDTSLFFQLSDDYSALKKAVQDFRDSIEKEVKLDQTTFQQYLSAGRSLYLQLIEPFAHRLPQLEQLLIIPDQLLDPVPFEAFLSEDVDAQNFSFKSLPYLLHQVQIVYTSAWKVYQANQQKKQTDFSNTSIGFWTTPELNTVNGLEVIEKSIQTSFGHKYEVFNQHSGGKQLFSQQHPQFDILHLLLHASSNRGNRYDNKIKFGRGEDEQVYGFELYKEKFKAKLAVLASCESAAGAPQSGEGTFSLARSFINSGIPEIVAAQFLIPQTTTGPLLSYFYQYLGSGYGTAASLHRAKIDFLQHTTKERHAYPRFWAGMVVFN